MEEKDYLKKQIDQLARALATLIGKVLGVTIVNEIKKVQVIDDFERLTSLDLESIINSKEDAIIPLLLDKGISNEAIEKIAIFLYHYANRFDKDAFISINLRVKEMYEYLKSNQTSISYDLSLLATKLNLS